MSVILKSDYYIVFMNPNKHKHEWNAMRLIMEISEINYCLFIDYETKSLTFYPVTKEEFKDYNYNPNLMLTITNEDNMLLMARYPDKYFDLAIVDIPYGLGDKLTQGGTWANKYKKGDADWDKLPTKEYFNELFRVSKNQIIWGGNYVELPATRCFLIWDKIAQMDTMSDCEFAWTSFNKNAKIFRHIRNTNEKRIHITQKPVALYKWILDKYAKQEDKILDTHLGSGSIAIACHDYGFDLTACELDTEYYEKAMQRIKNHTNQLKLFA